MRKLNFPDAFKVARVLVKLKLKDVLKEKIPEYVSRSEEVAAIEDAEEKEKQENAMGLDIIFDIMEHGEKAEEAFYDFLSGPLEMPKDEIIKISLEEIVPLLKEMAGQNNLTNFFKSALR